MPRTAAKRLGEGSTSVGDRKPGYGSNWKRWIWLYILIGGLIYLLVYLFISYD
jgi:hypothetical protein